MIKTTTQHFLSQSLDFDAGSILAGSALKNSLFVKPPPSVIITNNFVACGA